jgi:outer membrane receptor protein involved in Fe transport
MHRQFSNIARKRHAVATVSLLALCLGAQVAHAQVTDGPQGGPVKAANTDETTTNQAGGHDQAAPTGSLAQDIAAEVDQGEEITVTGSRIVRDGYSAPTPVSVLSAVDIETSTSANLSDFVNTMPSIAGSSTPSNSTAGLSGGTAGVNAINLRSLGRARTLVLLDGQRSVASTATGLVDINTFPQELVERVEVVTGGASAAYGSDAVGGVVNFILNKNFTGLKATADYGETTYGDGQNYKFTLTAGQSFFGDRLHVIFSGEYAKLEGIDSVNRDWNDSGYFHIVNPAYTATNGQPERYVGAGIGPSQVSPGGLIASGPLKGTYFGSIDPATGRATTGQLAYGAVNGAWMIGGDWRYTLSNYAGTNSLLPGDERISLFGRSTFEVTPNFEIFLQGSYNRYEGESYYIQAINPNNVTIRTDNAYLPTTVRTQLQTAGLSSFVMGTSNYGVPVSGSQNAREVQRYVIGAKGDFDVMGGNWKWDAYYQKGITNAHEALFNTWNNARMALAQDAVFAPAGNAAGIATGTIVCRSTLTAPTNGCVPINRIGVGGVTQAALNYIFNDGDQPYRDQKITQDVGALSFSGSLFSLPAGPLAAAFGVERRREAVDGYVETQFQTGWQYGNYLVNKGNYTVTEGFLELAIPVLKGLDLSAAGRFAHYSTSGDAKTWKLGATYQPIDDIRFRATISHDIRAPNLDELFAAGTARSNSVIVDGQPVSYVQKATGNPDLKPEVADTWSVGAVFTPTFLRGFAISVDYYEVEIASAIGSIEPQAVADLCYLQNVQAQCANITYVTVGNVQQISQILLKPFNFASQKARGIDIEASYRTELDAVYSGAPGAISLRAMFTNYLENLTDNGIDFPSDTAGTNITNGPPSWIYRLSALYNIEPMTFGLTGRGVSAGVYDNAFVECTSSCPASTIEHRTINDNDIAGAFYLDASIGYGFTVGGAKADLQFSVQNVMNTDPVIVGNGPTGNSAPAFPQASRNFYDLIGRTFRISANFKF